MAAILKHVAFAAIDVLERAALQAGEHRPVDGLRVLRAAEDEARPRACERLVRRRRDDVAVLDRVRVQAGCDEPGEVGHVAPEQRADLVGHLAGTSPCRPCAGRRSRRRGSSFGRCSRASASDLVLVDEARLARDAVVDDRVQPPGEVHLEPVGQVAPVVETQREDRVARLEQPEVHGHVRLRARVRLDVGVLGVEQGLGAVDRELLDLVDELAAAVVATPGIALRVLVRQHRAHRLEDGGPREVLRGDQLDLAALAIGLPADQRRDVGIVLGEPPGPQTLEVVGGDCHGPDATRCRSRATPVRRAVGTRSSPLHAGDGLRDVEPPVDAGAVRARSAEHLVRSAVARPHEVVAGAGDDPVAPRAGSEVVGSRSAERGRRPLRGPPGRRRRRARRSRRAAASPRVGRARSSRRSCSGRAVRARRADGRPCRRTRSARSPCRRRWTPGRGTRSASRARAR